MIELSRYNEARADDFIAQVPIEKSSNNELSHIKEANGAHGDPW